MEFNKKLQKLRNQKGLTQEELSHSLFVTRAAISKWESGRGYPNIESLKAIAKFFDITIDELISGEELLSVAEEETSHKDRHYCDMIFGLLDLSTVLLFFIPLLCQRTPNSIQEVSLISLTQISPWLKVVFYVCVISIIVCGALTLSLQVFTLPFWTRNKTKTSLFLSALTILVFIVSLQPYAAVFLFIYLIIKAIIMAKKQ